MLFFGLKAVPVVEFIKVDTLQTRVYPNLHPARPPDGTHINYRQMELKYRELAPFYAR
jgi:hypothetical protein